MNEDAILLVSYVFEIAFVFSLIIAALVFRTAWRTKRAEKLRQRASTNTPPESEQGERPET
jgi:hypothetical protein